MRHNRDPITSFKEKMVSAGLADADELKQIELEVRKSVEKDAKFAKADTEIDISELYNDVYEENLQVCQGLHSKLPSCLQLNQALFLCAQRTIFVKWRMFTFSQAQSHALTNATRRHEYFR